MKKLFEFREWPVYKASLKLCVRLYEIRTNSPEIGLSNLMDQMIRASNAIPLNIAESYSREIKKDKISFLRVAKGAAFECIAGMEILKRDRMINEKDYTQTYSLLNKISKMLNHLIKYIDKKNQE